MGFKSLCFFLPLISISLPPNPKTSLLQEALGSSTFPSLAVPLDLILENMRYFLRSFHLIESHFSSSKIMRFKSTSGFVSSSERGILCGGANPTNVLREPTNDIENFIVPIKCIMSSSQRSKSENCSQRNHLASQNGFPSQLLYSRSLLTELHRSSMLEAGFSIRFLTTKPDTEPSAEQSSSTDTPEIAPRIKFKRLDKTARHIMQILDKEAVENVRTEREIPDIKPGYIIQLKVEVPENKRRVSLMKGIVIARRNAGLNTTFRLRRLVAGVGIESVFPLYSPNIKEIKVVDKKKVRRAKLYYLRDQMQMNALKKSSQK